jgi:hypothetical protein
MERNKEKEFIDIQMEKFMWESGWQDVNMEMDKLDTQMDKSRKENGQMARK